MKKNTKVTTVEPKKAWAVIRTDSTGHAFMRLDEILPTPSDCEVMLDRRKELVPWWHRENPVVKIATVTITVDE